MVDVDVGRDDAGSGSSKDTLRGPTETSVTTVYQNTISGSVFSAQKSVSYKSL